MDNYPEGVDRFDPSFNATEQDVLDYQDDDIPSANISISIDPDGKKYFRYNFDISKESYSYGSVELSDEEYEVFNNVFSRLTIENIVGVENQTYEK